MQYGTSNFAGGDRTNLVSSGLSTLQLQNTLVPGGAGIEVIAQGTGIYTWGYSRGLLGRAHPIGSGFVSTTGVMGRGRTGVIGESSSSASTDDAGVIGKTDAFNPAINSNGVIGIADNGLLSRGVWGQSREGWAGYFDGKVRVTGQLMKSGFFFQIDHPLDPENKYLVHSGVESPDMKNVYDGTCRLDKDGSAWIELPEWFGELNRDYRYQLTPIGGPAPDLHIAEEILENRFRVAGGTAEMSVSWQVTGIRKDAWAEKNRIVVEEDKPDETRGMYLHPEAFDEPEARGEGYARKEALRSRLVEMREAEPPEPEVEEGPEAST
jgi:hypothetical protein